jgi:hypothetical protein
MGMKAFYPWSHDGFTGPHLVTVTGMNGDHVFVRFDDEQEVGVEYQSVFSTREAAEQHREDYRKAGA